MKKYTFLLFVILSSIAFSQNQGKIWYFGHNAGLDFNTEPPTVLLDNAFRTNEGCASIADTNGDLLFYTDGINAYNRNHAVMPNGATLGGNSSSSQSGIIVPDPANTDRYYIFAVSAYTNSDVAYSLVDMSLDGGNGAVVANNKAISLLTGTTESIQATLSSDGSFWWVVMQKEGTNSFYAYKVTAAGVDVSSPVISSTGHTIGANGDIGYIKFNTSGTKVVATYYQGNYFSLSDFNPTTGVVSNSQVISKNNAYGAEFSPNGNLLYVSSFGSDVTQYNATLGTQSATAASGVQISGQSGQFSSLQSAPDGKIYIAKGTSSLDVITAPNNAGAACNYVTSAQSLGGRSSQYGLPNIISAFVSTGPPLMSNCNSSSINSTEAVISADITSDGGESITQRGFYYGTTSNPTGNETIVSGTTGAMSATITGLTPGTLYYFRGFATNSNGTTFVGDCTFTTTASSNDTTAPVPDVAMLSEVTAQCEITSLTAPTATDDFSGAITGTTATTLPITNQGTTVVTWTYDDGNGNTATQTQNVFIDDTTPPVPDVASLPDVTSQCEVTTLTPPTATDNCGGTVTITNNATLPIITQGTTVVTWTYDDGNGNTFNQTQNVIIQDVTAPSITLPSEITVANDSGSCTAVVDYAAPIVSDNCVFPDETVAFLDRPSLFSGNARGYTFVVPQPMVITGLRVPTGASTGPQSIQVMRFANPISSFPTTNSYSELLFYTSRDPIDGFIPVNITLNTGDIIGILGVRDNVNAYSSSNSITIDGSAVQITRFGTQNPIDQIEAPQNTFWTEAFGSVSQVDFTYNLSAPVINQTAGLPSGSSFPVGTTINTFVATDISGNTTTQSFNVTVSDNEAPVADIAILADVIAECEVTSLVAPRATDNCTGVVTVTSDAVLPITGEGTTTVVTWTYDDGNGNTSTQTQNVIIDDVTAPVADVATLSDVTAECEVSSLVAPTATDNCSGIITATSDTTLPITTQGTTVVTWTYDDGNGNTSTQTQNVIIDDVTAPVITCPANITGNAPVVTFTNPTAIDNCDTIPFGGVANNDPIPGLTYLGFFGGKNLYVSDNPFTGAAAFANAQSLGGHLVTITDATVNSQIITALNNLGISDAFIGYSDAANEGTFVWQDGSTSNYENFNSGEPNNSGSGEDYVHIFGSGLWNDTSNNSSFVYIFQSANNRFYQSAGLPSGATYPLGATTNTFIVTDASGNASTCSFDVVLSDTTAPVPDVAMLSDVTAQCEMTSLTAPTATDDFSGAITGTTTTILPITTQGTTVVTWTYDDGNGNTSTQTQNVIIDDVTAPVADVTTLADVTAECEVLSLTVPTATDNCVGTVTATTSTIFPITSQGTTVVTWTYDDGNGNTSTQTQNVIIDDITVPVLDAVSLSNLVFNCEVTSLIAPTATDNCVGAVTGTTAFPITSTSVITWTFDDGNGNESTQDQLIIIERRSIDPIADVTLCDSFSLPAITGDFLTGGQMYYTQSGGNGNAFADADVINFSDFASYPVTLYAYDVDTATGCSAETSFQLTLAETPVINPIADVTECDQYTLPALPVGDYYTFPGGNGTVISAGTVISTTQTIFVYAEDVSGNCTEETSFTVTITPLDDASFNYASSIYCPSGMDPTPSITGLAGGSFTSTMGLVIDSATGTIDLDASTGGSYVITYTTNGDCPESSTVTVSIEDVTAPVADVAILADVTAECEVTTLTPPTATDNCSGTVTATSDAVFPITGEGTTTVVTWTYDDGNGNTSTQTQNVVIDDVTAPVADIASLSNLVFNCDVNSLTAPTATDNCSGVVTATTTAVFPLTSSASTITWTYDDGNGNISTQDQLVIIERRSIDTIADVAVCDSFTLPTITGNFLTGGQMYYTQSGGLGTAFAEADSINFSDFASYPVTLYAYDVDAATGCSTETSFDLTITETPVINPIADVNSCEQYELPVLTVGNYFTFPGGNGNLLAAGTVIDTTQTVFVYAEDASGNCTDETSFNVTINPSDISGATFNDDTFTYDGSVQSLTVENIPNTATVVYTNNDQTDAGTYVVTATITSATASCSELVLTATMTIDRAPQTITFDSLLRRRLNVDPDFQLDASSTSGLPIEYTFSFTGATPAATVSSTGFVSLLAEGEILISASQPGNANYLPATTVQQRLEVYLGDNADLDSITIDGNVINSPGTDIYYLIDCGSNVDSVDVVLENSDLATFDPSMTFTMATPRPGIYRQLITVTADNGRNTRVYNLVVERRFEFLDIVEQKFNNTLVVNNNFDNNGGYSFVAYEWYKNDRLVSREQFFSEGDNASDLLDPTAAYYVKMTTTSGDVLQTCISTIELGNTFSLTVLENPVLEGRLLKVRADYPSVELDSAIYQLYSATGQFIIEVPVEGVHTSIQLSESLPVGLYRLVLVTPTRSESVNFIKN